MVVCAPFYLDMLTPGNAAASRPPASLAERWRAVYEVDIMDGIAPALASSILGGQISAWGEAMSDANAHEIIWKVGGAAAEALWSPRDQPTLSDPGDEAEGLATEQRLSRWLCHLRGLGVTVGPILPSYCQVIRHQMVSASTGGGGCIDNSVANVGSQAANKEWLAVLGACVLGIGIGWAAAVVCSTRKHASRAAAYEDDNN